MPELTATTARPTIGAARRNGSRIGCCGVGGVVAISKLARVVETYAKGLHIQEK